MASITTGIEEEKEKFDRATPVVRRYVQADANVVTGMNIRNHARSIVTRVTSALHDAIEIVRNDDEGHVDLVIDPVIPGRRPGKRSLKPSIYWKWVEHGRLGKSAQPFLRPSIERERAAHDSRVEQAVEAALKAVFG